LWGLLWQHRHQLPQLSHRTWVAIAFELALLLASYHRQRFNRLSSAIASLAIIYTNKLSESWVGVSLYFDKPSNSPLQLEGIKSPD